MSMLQGLSKFARSEFPYMLRGLREGLSGRQILQVLRDTGRGYRTQTFYEDLGVLTKARDRWDTMKFVRRDSTITDKHYAYTQVPMANRYQTTIRVRGYSMKTGDPVERHVTLGHDSLRIRRELEDLASVLSQDTSPDLIVEELMPTQGRESPYW